MLLQNLAWQIIITFVSLKLTYGDKKDFQNIDYTAPERPFYALIRLVENETLTINCSGAVIDHDTVLTVASCFYNESSFKRERKSLTIGIGDFTKPIDEYVIFYPTSKVALHPDFVWDSDTNNLAVIKLKDTLSQSQQTIDLCQPDFDSGSNKIRISSLRTINSEVLLETTVKEEPEKCTDIAPLKPREEICMVDQNPDSKQKCKFDSGSPVLVVNKDNDPICLYGIVSYGDVKCRNTVAMNVSAFRDWVYKTSESKSSSGGLVFLSNIMYSLCALRAVAQIA